MALDLTWQPVLSAQKLQTIKEAAKKIPVASNCANSYETWLHPNAIVFNACLVAAADHSKSPAEAVSGKLTRAVAVACLRQLPSYPGAFCAASQNLITGPCENN